MSKSPNPTVKPLGELETAVMEHLWRGRHGEAKAVHDALGKKRGITLNTVQSTLKRLFEKGLLERDKVSHAHVYRPRLGREAYHRALLESLVGGLFHAPSNVMAQAFVDLAERAGPDHLAALEAAIARRKAAR